MIDALEGDQETEIVRHLLKLRDSLSRQDSTEYLSSEAEAAREHVINIVNNFFYKNLTSIPTIKAYMDDFNEKLPGNRAVWKSVFHFANCELESFQFRHVDHAVREGRDALQKTQAVFAQPLIIHHYQHLIEEFVDLRNQGSKCIQEVIHEPVALTGPLQSTGHRTSAISASSSKYSSSTG